MSLLQSFLLTLSFFTRIPVPPQLLAGSKALAQSLWAFPLVGAMIGALTGFFYLLLLLPGLPHGQAAWIALAFQLILTGALHEDGLADMADGLACGRDREKKLTIMHDSRIGTYGVLALLIVMVLRAQSIGHWGSGPQILWVMAAAGACSRACVGALMYALPAAKSYGLAAQAGRPSFWQVLIASVIGVAILWYGLHVKAAIGGLLVLICSAAIMAKMAYKHFGGITGDVLGATQQVTEVCLLILLSNLTNYPIKRFM